MDMCMTGVQKVIRSGVFLLGWVLLFVFLGTIPSLAQSMGTILGIVKDSSGGVLPQAKVTIVNTDTNDSRTATTGDDGSFRFPALVTGHYSVKIEKEGFKTETETGLTLEVTQELVVSPALEVGTSTQEVTVTGEAPMVNTTNSTLGGLVNEDKMADLPLNGRNYVDLVTMQAGINVAATTSSSAQTGGTRGTYFSADGATYRSNMYTLDGDILVNGRGGTTASDSGTSLGVDGIKEFKVVTGTFGAEYGNAMGGQVTMVSKNGTNQLHGDVFEYLRNDILDARNTFDFGYQTPGAPRVPHFERNNFGASAGGPIKKDKTFFFASYEGLRQQLGQTILDTVPVAGCHGPANTLITTTACPILTANTVVAPIVAPLLALLPLPNLPGAANNYTFPSSGPTGVDWGQIRVDQNISATDTLFGRYSIDKDALGSGVGGVNQPAGIGWLPFRLAQTSFNQSATISENHIFSTQLLNTARIAYTRINNLESVNYTTGVASVTGPQLSFVSGLPVGTLTIGGISSYGPNTLLPTANRDNYYQLGDDLFYSKGKHALKFGFLGVKWNDGDKNSAGLDGTLTFSNMTTFLAGNASSWASLFNPTTAVVDRNYMFYTYGFYLQDDYRVLSRLTLNLGLRYEFETQPHETDGNQYAMRDILHDATTTPGPVMAPFSKRNFSPRVGFAWDVFGNGKTAVRGGFGIYYDIGMMSQLLSGMSQGEPPLTIKASHNNAVIPPTQFTLPFSFQAGDVGGLMIMDYHMATPYILKWNLTTEQQLPFGMGLSLTYNGSHGVKLYQGIEGNPTIPVIVSGVPFWNGTQPLQNPLIAHTVTYTSDGGNSTYHALLVQLTKHLSHGLQFQAVYTYSHLLDTTATQGGQGDCGATAGMGQPSYPNDTSLVDVGPACFDITNNFRFNVLYNLPTIRPDRFASKIVNGWWMGSIYSFNTGYPFMPVLNTQRDRSGNQGSAVDRPKLVTAADVANCAALGSTCKVTPVVYDPNTVIIGTPQQWFNPNMFLPAPMYTAAGGSPCLTPGTAAACAWGVLGNVSRGMLRGPTLNNLDLSVNKDTALHFLGEQRKLVFRAEMFNILNHANYGMPAVATFAGGNGTATNSTTWLGTPYQQAVTNNAGNINVTYTTSRQIQLALKIVF